MAQADRDFLQIACAVMDLIILLVIVAYGVVRLRVKAKDFYEKGD